MRIEILGSGGAITTPKPGCVCSICDQARKLGIPYARTGPSIFVHGPNVLIDTPEEIKQQLNRSQVSEIAACFYSHWHPDHVMGRRVWEMNHDWRHWPPQDKKTDIYLPQQVAVDFRNRLGTWDHLAFFQQMGLVRLIELADGEAVHVGDTRVLPFRLAEDYVYGFIFEGAGKRILVVADELFGWQPGSELGKIDLAILPMGIIEHDPFTGARLIPEGHPVLASEATFEQTLDAVDALSPTRTVLIHIEEPDGLSYDELGLLSERLCSQGMTVEFAYDTMMIDP